MDKYIKALKKYYARLSNYEKIMKCGSLEESVFLQKYLKHAEFMPVGHHKVDGVVINQYIEFELPHTMDNIIILPRMILYQNIEEIIRHELIHIDFRQGRLKKYLRNFCKNNNLVLLRREKFALEITNPDTHDYYGLVLDKIIVFIVLTWGPKKNYYTLENGVVRVATIDEQLQYDKKLPYEQNYHPEEIIATILSR